MTYEWVYNFYPTQFKLGKQLFNQIPSAMYERLSQDLSEQIGKPFQTVLELGGGVGNLSKQLASEGKQVTMIEIIPELSDQAATDAPDTLEVIADDMHTVALNQTFDAIVYIDGFGVGEITDQMRLFHRIYDWLSDDGVALIDIYQPRYWREVAGIEMQIHPDIRVKREYGFDHENARMLDTWWEMDNPTEKVSQSLACYTHEEIYALADSCGLEIVGYYPGGRMDYDLKSWSNIASLNDCLSYRIKLRKKL